MAEEYALDWGQANKFLLDNRHHQGELRLLDIYQQSGDLYPILEIEENEYSLNIEESEGQFEESEINVRAEFEGILDSGYDPEEALGL